MGDTAQATTMAEACTVSAKLVPQCNLDGPVWLDQPGHQAQDWFTPAPHQLSVLQCFGRMPEPHTWPSYTYTVCSAYLDGC